MSEDRPPEVGEKREPRLCEQCGADWQWFVWEHDDEPPCYCALAELPMHHDFAAEPSRLRSVHRDDTVTITGAEYLNTRRRMREAEVGEASLAATIKGWQDLWDDGALTDEQMVSNVMHLDVNAEGEPGEILELRKRVAQFEVGAVSSGVDEDATLLEATRMLVEGRSHPSGRDRSEQFWEHQGQWTVWLTREQHERFKAALSVSREPSPTEPTGSEIHSAIYDRAYQRAVSEGMEALRAAVDALGTFGCGPEAEENDPNCPTCQIATKCAGLVPVGDSDLSPPGEPSEEAVEAAANAIAAFTPSNWPGDESRVTDEEYRDAARAALRAVTELRRGDA